MEKVARNSLPQSTNNLIQPVLIILIVIAAFFIGSLWTKVQILEKGGVVANSAAPSVKTTTTNDTPPEPIKETVDLAQIKDLFKKNVIKFGDANKKVLFIEIADPSCPYCHIAGGLNGELNKQVGDKFTLVADGGTYVAPVPEMKKLVDQGKAGFVYIYTPGHGNGEMGTKALYCANEKGKFWDVHDLLMTNAGYDLINNTVKNDKAKSGEIADYLKSTFDPIQMKSCLDSGKYDKRLGEDVAIASSLGVQGTPGFFVNATRFAGAYSYKDMESVVTDALK